MLRFQGATRIPFGDLQPWGVTNSQPNARQVHFGIDHAKVESEFADHGRLGDAVYVFSLCVHNGQLAESSGMKSEDYDLSIDSPLRIGFGAQDYFRGRITDVRLYRGELTATEIESKAALNPIDALRHE